MRGTAAVGLIVTVALGCAPPDQSTLALTLLPNRVVGAEALRARVVTTNADGTEGTGQITVTAPAGSLATGVAADLDAYGTATVTFTCDPTMEPACANAVVTATWERAGKPALTARASLTGAPSGTGGGGAGGSASTLGAGVWLVGSIGAVGDASLGDGSVALLTNPTASRITLPNNTGNIIGVTPAGAIIYRDLDSTVSPAILRFMSWAADALAWDPTIGGWAMPKTPKDNDVVVTVPTCTIADLLIWPDTGGLIAKCEDGQWHDGNTLFDATNVVMLGFGGHVLKTS
jgi:hypothetical protein